MFKLASSIMIGFIVGIGAAVLYITLMLAVVFRFFPHLEYVVPVWTILPIFLGAWFFGAYRAQKQVSNPEVQK